MPNIRPTTRVLLFAMLLTAVGAFTASQADDPTFRVGFGVRAITPQGEPPAEWADYFTPQPTTGIWGEPFEDLDGDGCYGGATNRNVEPVLDGDPPRGEMVEPHIDQAWNHTGDGLMTGIREVRGVTIVGDPSSLGKFDGLWANAGFGSTCTLGVADDTWARAVVMELGDDSVAMVSLDVVGLFNIEVRRARDEMKKRYPEMPIDELVVSSTHTHEGVDTMGYWGQLFLNTDGKFPAYQAFIRSQIIDAVYEAWTSREAAEVKLATGEQPMAIRDSRPPSVKDPRVPTAQFVRVSDGSTIGTIVNWNNHPEAQGSDNPYISSDFPHGTRLALEEETGAPAIYFSGMVGGLQTPLREFVPDPVTGEAMPDKTWERTYQLGRYVAESALEALAGVNPVGIDELDVDRRQFFLDMDNNVLRALNVRGIFDIPTYVAGESWGSGADHRDGIYTGNYGPQIQTEMVRVDIGAALFLTVPGEIAPELVIGGYGRPECPAADTGRPYEPVIGDQYEQPIQFILGLGQDELGYIIPGYDFRITSVGAAEDGRGVVPLGGLEVKNETTCGEGHYEETVSVSSVFAPWVACVGKELAGRDPWDMNDPENAACSYENTHTNPYGIDPLP
ncbi:MAG: hypothetical protein ACLGH3_07525 [Actinomycetota bacterium]